MRALQRSEVKVVAGGDGETISSAAINAPSCPPGYTGVVLISQTITTTGAGGYVQVQGGLIGPVPNGQVQGQLNTTPNSVSTTTTQSCLTDPSPSPSNIFSNTGVYEDANGYYQDASGDYHG